MLKSPYYVQPVLVGNQVEYVLERDDGQGVYMDNEVTVISVQYNLETAAIEAMQRYSREWYKAQGLVLE